MLFYPQERIALFLDGANLYGAAKGLQFDVDYKKLHELFAKKGIGNARKMLPHDFSAATYPNVVLIITVVNQEEADRDIPKLAQTPAAARGLSIEPMLGLIDLEYPKTLYPNGPPMCCSGQECGCMGRPIEPPLLWKIDWVITGGESAQLKGKRDLVPLQAQWVRGIAGQCAAADVPHHFKQWGYTIPKEQIDPASGITILYGARAIWKDGMGRALDGVEHNGFPPQPILAEPQPKKELCT